MLTKVPKPGPSNAHRGAMAGICAVAPPLATATPVHTPRPCSSLRRCSSRQLCCCRCHPGLLHCSMALIPLIRSVLLLPRGLLPGGCAAVIAALVGTAPLPSPKPGSGAPGTPSHSIFLLLHGAVAGYAAVAAALVGTAPLLSPKPGSGAPGTPS
eukprot:360607-Chlamydomonas_euryale.AAC.3